MASGDEGGGWKEKGGVRSIEGKEARENCEQGRKTDLKHFYLEI